MEEYETLPKTNMSLMFDVENYCNLLKSNKIVERRKCSEQLTRLLENDDTIEVINKGDAVSWKKVLFSVQECLKLDADKNAEAAKKKTPIISQSSELFTQVVKIITRQAQVNVDIPTLVGYIIGCMKDNKMKICYERIYLNVLKDYILPNSTCRGKLGKDGWEDLYYFFQKLCEEKKDDHCVFKCYMFVIKYGPNSGLSAHVLRNEFSFLTKLCQMVDPNSSKLLQEDILEIALTFCRQTVKDCKISCCKLGEDIIPSFISLYDNPGREAKTKELIVEFLLLQTLIHHPNGAVQNHPYSCASNWNMWQKCLKMTYSMVMKELHSFFKFPQKNKSFFNTSGETITVSTNFSQLVTEVSRQLFANSDVDVTMSDYSITQGPQKRQKLEISLRSYICNIQETRNWLWIHIVCQIIEKYPEIMEPEEYLSLLQILSALQIESNDNDVLHNIYICFSVMMDRQELIDVKKYEVGIMDLWKSVGENILRVIALNQHRQVAGILLQKLVRTKFVDLNVVLQTYTTGVQNVSIESIECIDVGLRVAQLGKIDNNIKKILLQYILNPTNLKEYKYIIQKQTAKFLVDLSFKKWPETENILEKEKVKEIDIIEIHLKSLMESILVSPKQNNGSSNIERFSHDLDSQIFDMLTIAIQNFILEIPDTTEILTGMLVLLTNITSYLVDYKIINRVAIQRSPFWEFIKTIFQDEKIQNFNCYRKERELSKLLECVNNLNILFSDCSCNKVIVSLLRDLVPVELLKSLLTLLTETEDKIKSEWQFELKIALIQTLAGYCFCGNDLTDNQYFLMEVIANDESSYESEEDYKMFLIFWQYIKNTTPGTIPEEILEIVIKSLKEICCMWRHCSEKIKDILDLLFHLYPHFFVDTSNDLKIDSVEILKVFYQERFNYGPDILISLINCMRQLCKLDPKYQIASWSDKEIIRYILDFSCNDYQEVRYRAVEAIVEFFQQNDGSHHLRYFHRKEEIFENIFEKSTEIFNVSGTMTEERRIDETISRTASVLHTFASISVNCPDWLEPCLFTLLKLIYLKNIEYVDRALKLISNHYFANQETNILEKYLEVILERWTKEGLIFDNFPFNQFGCKDKMDFFVKYFDVCVVHLICNDSKLINDVANRLEISEKEIVAKAGPIVFGRVLFNNHDNLDAIITGNNPLAYCMHIVGSEEFKNILIGKLEHTITAILQCLTDEAYIMKFLKTYLIFPDKKLSTQQVQKCLNYLETFLWNGQELVTFLTGKNLSKLERTLFILKQNFHDAITDQSKFKAIHQYSFFLQLVFNEMNKNSKWQHYFMRDTIYTLINWIHMVEESEKILTTICCLLMSCIKQIMPDFCTAFAPLLSTTVNCLKYLYRTHETLKNLCWELMNYFIVDGACILMDAIEKLDNFPNIPEFETIRMVHFKIKYGNSEASLDKEIEFFLQHQDQSTRLDSLIHLRNALSKQKKVLKHLCDELEKQRGFTEDCESSILHRLIATLVKISYSTDEKVVLEALGCLGEIGPVNLSTLVLQPEKAIMNVEYTAVELFSGYVVSLIERYINDRNINLAKLAADALYTILQYKEPRKMAETEEKNFVHENLESKYILPYIPLSRKSITSNVSVDVKKCVSTINSDDLWIPETGSSHDQWITSLVSTLLGTFTDKSFLDTLIPISKAKPEFSEQILPPLINLLLFVNNKHVTEILSRKVEMFFSLHWKYSISKADAKESIAINKKSVKIMLDVINFVRLFSCSQKNKSRSVGELAINYLKVAKAAEFCASHFNALYYSELWCQTRIEELQEQDKSLCHQRSTFLDTIYENESEVVGETLHNILRNGYKAIGDLDALPGCGISFLLKPYFRVEHYKEHNKWDQVTHHYALQVHHTPEVSSKELMNSFKKSGLYQIPLLCSNTFIEPQYECLWRLSQWDNGDNRIEYFSERVIPEDFEKFRFLGLKALHDNNQCTFEDIKKNQIRCLMAKLKETSLESSENIYPILTQLKSIVEMEDFFKSSMDRLSLTLTLSKWTAQDKILKNSHFSYVEPIISQRLVMLSDFLIKYEDSNLKEYFKNLALDFAVLAKDNGYFKEGQAILERLRNMQIVSVELDTKIQIIDAELSWFMDNKLIAKHILHKICKNADIDPRLKSKALTLFGQYLSESYSENRLKIISDYFSKSITTIKNVERSVDDNLELVNTYDKLACFADQEYQQVKTYMQSQLFEKKVANMEKAKKAAQEIKNQKKLTHDEMKAAAIQSRQSSIDEIEISNAKQESNQFLTLALKYYVLNLYHSDNNDIRIFRIISLFIENRNNSSISELIKEYLPKIPTHKYIMMLPQLVPHITDTNSDSFSQEITNILEKCAIDHPHHTLPLLLSLSNANKDREFTKEATKTLQNDGRINAAVKLINKLKDMPKLARIIQCLQQLSEALIDLAYYKGGNDENKTFEIPYNHKIRKIKNFDDITVPTDNLKISQSNNYSNIIGIESFESSYQPVGGINAPKKILCRGTDGKTRFQLVKGQDDLRQDAVMQQVFVIMNNLLSSNRETKNLFIRTYKIVPLSMRSGILEWVNNSMPIGLYLVGDKDSEGAHQKYGIRDKSASSCKLMIKNSANRDANYRLQTYKKICEQFKPVFHKFFEEYFHQPTVWYERRRAYIHSVATTSMCGYILGIGDRHVSNILIDTRTAEVIHIDFGIAFEQGRVLPTPETVPFRLTRDIVDGMGASGVEGIFRRSCEKTMKILRQNSQTIITILEVLLYDPLYAWTVTSAEANRRQRNDETDFSNTNLPGSSDEDVEVNITAERALLRLKEKLQGTEQGQQTSIEHQVGTLIQQATDPANLCRLFYGWQAYL